jgi:glyoxylase-like metal-dependent hydrolase (beta-lactamase superfamily II)
MGISSRTLATILALALLSGAASSQNHSRTAISRPSQNAVTAGLQSYVRARKVLDAALEAIGGLKALQSTKTVRRRLVGDWFGSGQHPRPYVVAAPSLKTPPSNGHNRVVSFIDYGGRRSLDESTEADVASDDSITRITAVTGESGFETITYRDERPYYRKFSAEEARSFLVRKFRLYPEGLLRVAFERPETLAWVGFGEELGRKQQVISFADPNGSRVFLYVDEKTSLLTKSETLREHAVAGDSYAEQLYFDYRPVGRLRLPFHVITRTAGIPTEEMRAKSIEVNVEVAEEKFRAPGNFAVMGQNATSPAVEKLGERLYVIHGPYNIVFAEFQDHVMVFEAPISSRYSETCMALIRETIPNKPIRYVVATHFHYDHVAGLRPYIAEGVTIITTPDAKAVIEKVAASHRTMYPDALSHHPRAPRIETIRDHRTLSDATNRVELYDIGPSDHVVHILGAYFPAEKLLFEADLWDPISLELVIAGADTTKLAAKIQHLGLDVQRIIPVHGIDADIEALKRGLAVRAKYAGSP